MRILCFHNTIVIALEHLTDFGHSAGAGHSSIQLLVTEGHTRFFHGAGGPARFLYMAELTWVNEQYGIQDLAPYQAHSDVASTVFCSWANGEAAQLAASPFVS